MMTVAPAGVPRIRSEIVGCEDADWAGWQAASAPTAQTAAPRGARRRRRAKSDGSGGEGAKTWLVHDLRAISHSHSMVPGGLLVMSRTTRLMPRTSLMIRFEIRAKTS